MASGSTNFYRLCERQWREAIHTIVTMKGIVREPLINLESRHCERREAIHCINGINILWIAAFPPPASLHLQSRLKAALLAMTKLCKGSLVLCRLLTLLFMACFLLHYFAVAKIAGIGATHIMLTGFALRDDNEN